MGNESGEQIGRAIGVMDSHIKKALGEKDEDETLGLWQVHADHIANSRRNGGKCRGFKELYYSSIILSCWAMAFLARTSYTLLQGGGKGNDATRYKPYPPADWEDCINAQWQGFLSSHKDKNAITSRACNP